MMLRPFRFIFKSFLFQSVPVFSGGQINDDAGSFGKMCLQKQTVPDSIRFPAIDDICRFDNSVCCVRRVR